VVLLQTFLVAIAQILHILITIYIWVVIIQSLLGWVQPNPYNPVVQFLDRVTSPVYWRIKRRFNTVFGGIDIAPLIIILALEFCDLFFVKLLFNLAASI
jgi:YggT family protein